MQGDWSAQSDTSFYIGTTPEKLERAARFYYRMADAMLKAREAK